MRPRASERSCSRSSSKSQPCECGQPWRGEGHAGARQPQAAGCPLTLPRTLQLQAEPGPADLLRRGHGAGQRCREPPAAHLGGEDHLPSFSCHRAGSAIPFQGSWHPGLTPVPSPVITNSLLCGLEAGALFWQLQPQGTQLVSCILGANWLKA